MKFSLSFCNDNVGFLYSSCHVWRVHVTFAYVDRANIDVSVTNEVAGNCNNRSSSDTNAYYLPNLLNVSICVLGLAYLILIVKEVLRRIDIYRKVKRAHAAAQKVTCNYSDDSEAEDEIDSHFHGEEGKLARNVIEVPWQQLPWAVIFDFFPMWLAITFLGIAATVCYGSLIIFDAKSVPATLLQKMGCGFSCALLWVSFAQFYRGSKKYSAFILTMKHALPILAPFLIGVLPVIIGYAVFGLSYFGSHLDAFASLSNSINTLFSVLNSDVIYEMFTSLWAPNQVVVNVYLYSFIVIFVYLVLSVTISVIEHSYFVSQGTPRTFDMFIGGIHGLHDDDDDDNDDFAKSRGDGDGGDAWSTIPSSSAVKSTFFAKRRCYHHDDGKNEKCGQSERKLDLMSHIIRRERRRRDSPAQTRERRGDNEKRERRSPWRRRRGNRRQHENENAMVPPPRMNLTAREEECLVDFLREEVNYRSK